MTSPRTRGHSAGKAGFDSLLGSCKGALGHFETAAAFSLGAVERLKQEADALDESISRFIL